MEDKKAGAGELALVSGARIKGNWREGKIQSPALVIYPEGHRYIGEISAEFMHHGFGVCVYSNDDRYYGNWNHSTRHGKGMMVTRGGTEYNGNWYNDSMEGNGVLRSSNDECYFLLSKVNGSWYSEGLNVQGTLRLRSIADRTSRDSTLNGDKWEGFVETLTPKKVVPKELLNDEVEALHQAIQSTLLEIASLGSASNSNGDTSPQEALKTALRDEISKIFRSRVHPLGRYVGKFSFIFSHSFPAESLAEINPQTWLIIAVDDLKSFISLMTKRTAEFIRHYIPSFSTSPSAVNPLTSTASSSSLSTSAPGGTAIPTSVIINNALGLINLEALCCTALNNVLFSDQVVDCLTQLYNSTNEDDDDKIDQKFRTLKALPTQDKLKVCGVDKALWPAIEELLAAEVKIKISDLNPQEIDVPYQTSVSALRQIIHKKTVKEKLECVLRCANFVEKILSKLVGSFGADELLPMFCFVMIEASVPNLQSECNYLEDFLDDEMRYNVLGYMMAQMQISASFFKSVIVEQKVAAPL